MEFNGFDRKKGMLSLILAVLVAVGMKVSFLRKLTEVNSPDIDLLNEKMVFFRLLYRSMPSNKLQLALMILAIALLIYIGLSVEITGKDRFIYACVALLFASTQLIAQALRRTGQWEVLYFLPIQRIRVLIRGLSLAIVVYFILKDALFFAEKLLVQEKREGSQESHINPLMILGFATMMFLAWLPYFKYFYPGTSNEDTVIMIMEYFHVPSYIQKLSPVQGEDIFITNHHPYLLILLFGRFVKLGLDLGDIRLGIAIYTLLHMVFLACVFAVSLTYLYHVGVSKKRTVMLLFLLMFFPIFPLYAICMVKDTIYGAFCLLFMMLMDAMVRSHGEILEKPWFMTCLFLDVGLMMLTKVYAIYLLAIIGVACLLHYKKQWRRLCVTFAVPMILFQFLYLNTLLPALNVAPGGVQEALSVPFQQTARYVTEYPEEVTKKEQKALDAIIKYKYWTKCYNPKLSDDLKARYDQEATKEDLRAYFAAWWQMFKKHPGVYFEATFHNTYEYYDINKISSLVYYEWNTYLLDHPKLYADEDYLTVMHDEETAPDRYVLHQLVLIMEKVPILNLFAAVGLLPWLIIFMLLLNRRRGLREYDPVLLLPIITFLICLTSPDNGNYRYIIPTMFGLPFLFLLVLLPKEGEKNS